jgi:hypothetical protein
VVLHSKPLGAIGILKMGDFIGEDLVFDMQSQNAKEIMASTMNLRNESAYSEGDTYLLEF